MSIIIFLAFILLFIGIFGLCLSINHLKQVICLNLMQSGIIILFITLGYRIHASIPINTSQINIHKLNDPLPAVLMLTAIVVSFCVTCLAYALIKKINDNKLS